MEAKLPNNPHRAHNNNVSQFGLGTSENPSKDQSKESLEGITENIEWEESENHRKESLQKIREESLEGMK